MNQEQVHSNGSGGPSPISLPREHALELAEAVAKSLKGSAAPLTKTGFGAASPSFASFAGVLGELVEASSALREELEQMFARVARQYLVEQKLQAPSLDEFLIWLRGQGAATKGGTVVRAFWWGFHVEISHEDLQAFLSGAGSVNTIVATIGGGIPSPAQPWIVLIAGFIAGALSLLQGLDRGRGVYVSMTWFAPGAFVPTSV